MLNVGAGAQFNCWRFPPVIVPTSFGGVTAPPTVGAPDWCGEFSPAPAPLASVR
jgi:hypothetical protein